MDGVPDVVHAGVEERRRDLSTGVVDEDVQAAERFDGAVNQSRQSVEVSDISRQSKGPTARRHDLVRQGVHIRLGPGHHGNSGSGFRKAPCDARADAPPTAGDERDPVAE